ncbi:uncharacterized protein ARMOST_07195 [Armillaria ostoyae]|uniref:Uncharacterized protein n=1 Tax=Armillaria ostoyae TaxID=47428 RepID=A0A284R551_ARMOS|nr:uncharacterized protein ARMOST_07195 [Armillaria ostoyae]
MGTNYEISSFIYYEIPAEISEHLEYPTIKRYPSREGLETQKFRTWSLRYWKFRMYLENSSEEDQCVFNLNHLNRVLKRTLYTYYEIPAEVSKQCYEKLEISQK